MKLRIDISSAKLGNFPPAVPKPRFRSSRRLTINSSAVALMASVLTGSKQYVHRSAKLQEGATYLLQVMFDLSDGRAGEGR